MTKNEAKSERPVPGEVLIQGKGTFKSWLYRGFLIIEMTGADFGRRGWLRGEIAYKLRFLEDGKEFDLIPCAENQPKLKEALWYADKLLGMYKAPGK